MASIKCHTGIFEAGERGGQLKRGGVALFLFYRQEISGSDDDGSA